MIVFGRFGAITFFIFLFFFPLSCRFSYFCIFRAEKAATSIPQRGTFHFVKTGEEEGEGGRWTGVEQTGEDVRLKRWGVGDGLIKWGL